MAVITQRAGVKETVRQKRDRDQELLVWPDLVFIEFIAAMVFTIAFVVLSVLFDAPLLNKANPAVTPDPSKAPWYFMNLQELLLHMDKGLAGVIVPTVLLIALMIIPYVDRSNEGQGGWFATPNAIRITVFSFVYTGAWITWLILWDNKSHVLVYRRLPYLWGEDASKVSNQLEWPGDKGKLFWEDALGPVGDFLRTIYDFIFLSQRLALRDEWKWSLPVPWQVRGGDGHLDWPQDFKEIPLPLNGTWIWHWGDPGWLPGWARRFYPYDGHMDIPAITAEYVLPIIAMIGLPALMLFILFKLGWAQNMRDAMIALFTGFIITYLALTGVGGAFRGHAQNLVPPSHVPNLEHNPSIQRYEPRPSAPLAIIDLRTGTESHG